MYRPDTEDLVVGKLEELLTGGISAQQAVQICLLNNPKIQAAFFTVGITSADVVQSGLFSNPTRAFSPRFPAAGGATRFEASVAQNIIALWQIPMRKREAERRRDQAIEVVESHSDVFVIADLSIVRTNVTVYAQDTPRITPGQSVHIQSEGFPMETTGKISYISPLIDKATRTTRARVLIPNDGNTWKPGMFVSARAVLKAEPVRVLVPNDAVQTVKKQSVVFVPENDGYIAQPVTIGRANAAMSQIVAGLEPGELYVAKGAFVLKAELGKEEGGHEH